MVSPIAASAFFPIQPSSSMVSMKASKSIGESPASSSSTSSRTMKTKTQMQALPKKANTTMVGLQTETQRIEEDAPTPSALIKTCCNQLPDWSFLSAAITTIFLAAEKQFTLVEWKPRRADMHAEAFVIGKIVENGVVFRQNFCIRSYEIGPDRRPSVETLMHHLQETALNQLRCLGLMDGDFGSTPEMSKRNLIWVVIKTQLLVEKYPSWGDLGEIETWMAPSGKNGIRRNWCVRHCQTGQTVLKATSVCVMMNKKTRRASKIPEEVRAEIEPYFRDITDAVLIEDSRKLLKLEENAADYVRKGLSPRWSDLDVNQHVNHAKYVCWILESVPISILESHELRSLALEYRRECRKDSMLRSLAAVSGNSSAESSPENGVEYQHLLQMDSGAEIMRSRTEWRAKNARGQQITGQF